MKKNYTKVQKEYTVTREYLQLEYYSKFLELIIKLKPHYEVIDGIYKSGFYSDDGYNCEQIGIKIFDTQKKIYTLLNVIVRGTIENLEAYQKKIIDLKQNFFNMDNQNKHEDNLKQIQKQWEDFVADGYIIGNNCAIVYELDYIELPLQQILQYINQDNIEIILKIKNKIEHFLKQKYQKQYSPISFDSFYISINDEDEIYIKYLHYIKYITPPIDQGYNSQAFYLQQVQADRIKNIPDQKIKESLRRQLDALKEKNKIQKQDLSNIISKCAPKLIQDNNHCIQIFQILEQHPKYTSYSLIDYGCNYVILKSYSVNKKYRIKLEKYNSLNEANTLKEKYELLKEYQQKENEGVFLDIGDCEIICVESGWYVLLEENFSIKQQNYKLIPLAQVDRIIKHFPQINCSQDYIQVYLIIRNLQQYEFIQQLGFSKQELENCKPYICISNFKKFGSNKIVYSNPYFVQIKQQQLSFRLIDQFIDIFQSPFVDLDLKSFRINFKSILSNYLLKQEQIQQYSKFPELELIINQIKNYIAIFEQFPDISDDEFYLNEYFDMILSFNTDNFKENRGFYQIVQKQIKKFICPVEDFPKCLKYLTKDNNIQSLQIKSQKHLNERDQSNISQQLKNVSLTNETIINSFVSTFQNVQELFIEYSNSSQINISVTEFQQLSQLHTININFQYYSTKKSFIDYYELFNQIKHLFEIFEKIKFFQIIDINFRQFKDFDFIDFKDLNLIHGQQLSDTEYEQYTVLIQNINSFTLLHNQQDQDLSKKLINQISDILCDYQSMRCESSQIIQANNQNEEHILQIQFNDKNIDGLGSIVASFKLYYGIYGFQFELDSFETQNQYFFKCYDNNFYKLLFQQNKKNYLKKLLGINPFCEHDIINQLVIRFYSNQTQLKSIQLFLDPGFQCSLQSFRNTCDILGLTNGNHFLCLQEIILNVCKYETIFINYTETEIMKDLKQIIDKNKSVNTIRLENHEFQSKIRNIMLKLKRVVCLKVHYLNYYDNEY